jgi:hypothetical protein
LLNFWGSRFRVEFLRPGLRGFIHPITDEAPLFGLPTNLTGFDFFSCEHSGALTSDLRAIKDIGTDGLSGSEAAIMKRAKVKLKENLRPFSAAEGRRDLI